MTHSKKQQQRQVRRRAIKAQNVSPKNLSMAEALAQVKRLQDDEIR